MTTILSIDPGKITGLAWGHYDKKTPYELDDVAAWNFDEFSEYVGDRIVRPDVLLVERFIPQSGGNFTLKEDDLAGVEVIGLIKHSFEANETYWRTRSDKTQVSDQVLKDHGLWQTGKDVNWSDGRDVNDSLLHALGHLAFTKEHEPTLRRYFH